MAGHSPVRRRLRGPSAPPSPGAIRRSWLRLLEEARRFAADPDVNPLELAHQLRGVKAASFPIPAGDASRAVAEAFLTVVKPALTAAPERRRLYAPVLLATIDVMDGQLREQGAGEAQAAMARTGFRDG